MLKIYTKSQIVNPEYAHFVICSSCSRTDLLYWLELVLKKHHIKETKHLKRERKKKQIQHQFSVLYSAVKEKKMLDRHRKLGLVGVKFFTVDKGFSYLHSELWKSIFYGSIYKYKFQSTVAIECSQLFVSIVIYYI